MTLQEYNDNLKELVDKTSQAMSEEILVTNASRMLGSMHVRVFRKGLDSNGQRIGTYSTKPGYFTKKEFIQKGKFKPAGKTGKKKFNNGAPHKSMFLKEGYKELRATQGRRTDYVNFEYRGDLEGSLKMEAEEKDVLIGFDNEKESKIRKGLEEKYRRATNTIFPASEKEKGAYREGVVDDLRETEYDILTGVR